MHTDTGALPSGRQMDASIRSFAPFFVSRLRDLLLTVAMAAAFMSCAPVLNAAPIKILFVGNSYTFGRLDPVMSYNAASVHDLTAPFQALNSAGTNPWEPHPWGGIAGI